MTSEGAWTAEQSWERARAFYHDRLQHHEPIGPMIDLVERIIASPYHVGLFARVAWPSTLGIAQQADFDKQEDVLIVYPGSNDDLCPIFRYQDAMWRATDPFAAFERFLERVRWFVDCRRSA